jgi:hypothetical protein
VIDASQAACQKDDDARTAGSDADGSDAAITEAISAGTSMDGS